MAFMQKKKSIAILGMAGIIGTSLVPTTSFAAHGFDDTHYVDDALQAGKQTSTYNITVKLKFPDGEVWDLGRNQVAAYEGDHRTLEEYARAVAEKNHREIFDKFYVKGTDMYEYNPEKNVDVQHYYMIDSVESDHTPLEEFKDQQASENVITINVKEYEGFNPKLYYTPRNDSFKFYIGKDFKYPMNGEALQKLVEDKILRSPLRSIDKVEVSVENLEGKLRLNEENILNIKITTPDDVITLKPIKVLLNDGRIGKDNENVMIDFDNISKTFTVKGDKSAVMDKQKYWTYLSKYLPKVEINKDASKGLIFDRGQDYSGYTVRFVDSIALPEDSSYMFADSYNLNYDITPNLDTSKVKSMKAICARSNANPNTSSWNTSNVEDFSDAFMKNTKAQPDTKGWNTAKAKYMQNMFFEASIARPDTRSWSTSNVENMSGMFYKAELANPDTSRWNTAKVTTMKDMFNGATNANPDTSEWILENVTTLEAAFKDAISSSPVTGKWKARRALNLNETFKNTAFKTLDLRDFSMDASVNDFLAHDKDPEVVIAKGNFLHKIKRDFTLKNTNHLVYKLRGDNDAKTIIYEGEFSVMPSALLAKIDNSSNSEYMIKAAPKLELTPQDIIVYQGDNIDYTKGIYELPKGASVVSNTNVSTRDAGVYNVTLKVTFEDRTYDVPTRVIVRERKPMVALQPILKGVEVVTPINIVQGEDIDYKSAFYGLKPEMKVSKVDILSSKETTVDGEKIISEVHRVKVKDNSGSKDFDVTVIIHKNMPIEGITPKFAIYTKNFTQPSEIDMRKAFDGLSASTQVIFVKYIDTGSYVKINDDGSRNRYRKGTALIKVIKDGKAGLYEISIYEDLLADKPVNKPDNSDSGASSGSTSGSTATGGNTSAGSEISGGTVTGGNVSGGISTGNVIGSGNSDSTAIVGNTTNTNVDSSTSISNNHTGNGWKLSNEKWTYTLDGKVHTGWLKDGDVWYFMDKNGIMQTGWLHDKNAWYYLKSNGVMATGWVHDGSAWYYLSSSGAMATGWYKDKGTWYYSNSSGVMATGWVHDGSAWYYLSSSGAMQTGWIWYGNNWYYLNSNGAMVTDWQLIGGKWYYFSSSGQMK